MKIPTAQIFMIATQPGSRFVYGLLLLRTFSLPRLFVILLFAYLTIIWSSKFYGTTFSWRALKILGKFCVFGLQKPTYEIWVWKCEFFLRNQFGHFFVQHFFLSFQIIGLHYSQISTDFKGNLKVVISDENIATFRTVVLAL